MAAVAVRFRRPGSARQSEPEPVATAAPPEPESADPRRTAGKGRPTPKRREADTRARGPVAPPPTTRREAYRRMRAEGASKRQTIRESARKGDDSGLPTRDRGPIRRLARDVVDTRRNVASLFLPFAVIFLAGYFVPQESVQRYLVLMWTCFFLLVIVDSFGLGRRLRKLVRQRFPDEQVRMRGLIFYAIQRSTMIRRWRFPKPALSPNSAV